MTYPKRYSIEILKVNFSLDAILNSELPIIFYKLIIIILDYFA